VLKFIKKTRQSEIEERKRKLNQRESERERELNGAANCVDFLACIELKRLTRITNLVVDTFPIVC